MKRSKGFTLVELLVVVAIIALLVSILLPTLARARELAKRAICQANLNGIGKAIMIYYADSKDAFPCIATTNGILTFDVACTSLSTTTPYVAGTAINPLDNLGVLVYKGNLTWKMFLCPSTTSKEKDRSGGVKYGFGGQTVNAAYIDYGLQIPYLNGTANQAGLSGNADGGLAIMADRPPDDVTAAAVGSGATKFSPNHSNEGEGVLYAGGNVKWSDDKTTANIFNTAGWGNNNIYLEDMNAADAIIGATPPGFTSSRYDSVIFWKL